jgi:processive 1,2-diacylglycerol beta-glucosyltransferase
VSEPVLLLSGSIGAGHDAVAAACAAALGSVGTTSEVLDCMRLPGRGRAWAGAAAFRALLRRPALYDAFHFSQLRAGSPLAAWMERAAAQSLAPALSAELDARSTRLAIAVFATGAGALGRLRAVRPDLRAAVVLTDATAHRLWAHPGVDRYLALSPLAAATLRRYLPRADAVVIPPPVRPGCYSPLGRDEARRRLGLGSGAGSPPVVLLTAGGWGRASLDEIAAALLAAGLAVVALAGSNAALLRRLGTLAGALSTPDRGRLVVRGWSSDVPELMAASDVVVTAPGQSCHEARAVGRPLVVLDAVPGHGRENLLAELATGGAVGSGPEPAAVREAVTAVLDGVAGALPRWPVRSADQWNSAFLDALGPLRSP